MPPWLPGARRPRHRLPSGPLAVILVLLLIGIGVSACGASGPAFDPAGPCLADGKAEGAYPELEARLPSSLDGRAPDNLDSGRNCSAANLGTLADHGIAEVRFAGGLWERGAESGTTLAVFTADGLTADRLGEFYEAGARAGRKTEDITVSHPEIGGQAAYRLDLVNNGMLQTIVTLESGEPGVVRAVLVSSAARDVGEEAAHQAAVDEALAAWDD